MNNASLIPFEGIRPVPMVTWFAASTFASAMADSFLRNA